MKALIVCESKYAINKMQNGYGYFIHCLSKYGKPQSKFDSTKHYYFNMLKRSYYEYAKAPDIKLPEITFELTQRDNHTLCKNVTILKTLKNEYYNIYDENTKHYFKF